MQAVLAVHRTIAFAIVAGWGALFVFGGVLFLAKRDAGRVYWGLLTVLQVIMVVQIVAGVTLLALGGRRAILHYFYGSVFPGVVLIVAHLMTRDLTKPPYHVFFTIAAFFVFGLTARALMTGLGIG